MAGCVCHSPLLPRQAELTSPAALSVLAGLLDRSRQGSGTPLTRGQNDLRVGGAVVLKVDALDRPLVRIFRGGGTLLPGELTVFSYEVWQCFLSYKTDMAGHYINPHAS